MASTETLIYSVIGGLIFFASFGYFIKRQTR